MQFSFLHNRAIWAVLALFCPSFLFGQLCSEPQPTPGFSSDSACEQAICAVDPFCCETQWDSLCADAAVENPSCASCSQVEIQGCTNSFACNYDPEATVEDGSCIMPDGCTNPAACNFEFWAVCDNGTCEFSSIPTGLGCADPGACNYMPDACSNDFNACEYDNCPGCTYPQACNYDPQASSDDGSCNFDTCAGCTYAGATNYNAVSTIDDGSCLFEAPSGCEADLNGDGLVTVGDLNIFLSQFGSICAP